MNTHNLKTQHETAIEKLNDVDTQRRLKDLAEESINGFEGLHMPDQKRKAEQSRDKCQVKIHEAMVDYRKHTIHHILSNLMPINKEWLIRDFVEIYNKWLVDEQYSDADLYAEWDEKGFSKLLNEFLK